MRPTAVDEVVLSILVAEYKWINRLSAVPDLVHERFAQQIMEGSARLIGHSHADAANLLVLIVNVIGAKEEVIFPVPLCYRRGPHGSVRPGYAIGIQNSAVLGPVNQIRRGEGVKEYLLVVPRRIGRIDPIM